MKIKHYISENKPNFIDVYHFTNMNDISLHYLEKEWDKSGLYLVGKWNIKYKTND